MKKRNIQDLLEQLEELTNFHERDFSEAEDMSFFNFAFDFSDIKYTASQITSPLFTLNRFSFLFEYVLKKEHTKLIILEAINQYNADTPLIKLELAKLRGKKLELIFSTDFINDDTALTKNQLEAIINIMAGTPFDFGKLLIERKIAFNRA